jgi:hypothetical protein
MNPLDLARLLFEFEDQRLEFYKNLKIGKWNSWVILRRPLFYFFYNKERNAVIKSEKKRSKLGSLTSKLVVLLNRIADFFSLLFSLIKVQIKKKKDPVVLMAMSVYKVYTNKEGKKVDVRMDPFVINKILPDYLYLETSTNGALNKPALVPYDLLLNGLYLPLAILKSIFFKIQRFNNLSAAYCKELNRYGQENNLKLNLSPGDLKIVFANFYSEFLVYKWLFLFIKPKVVIFNDQLFSGKMAAAIACGAKTVELQHGLIGDYKADYYLSGKLQEIIHSLPICNKLGLFGQFHKDAITRGGFWKDDQINNLGHYVIDQIRKERIQRNEEQLVILFPTQWSVFSETSLLLEDMLSFISDRDILVIIKCHPREPIKNLEWFKNFVIANSRNFKLFTNEYDVYTLMLKADLVIGFYTTALLESVAVGIPTITVTTENNPNGIHSYIWTDQLKNAIRIGGSVAEITGEISSFMDNNTFKKDWQTEVDKQSEYLYAYNFNKNIKQLIDEVLEMPK